MKPRPLREMSSVLYCTSMAHTGACVLEFLGVAVLGPASAQPQMPSPAQLPAQCRVRVLVELGRGGGDHNSCPQSPGRARSWDPGLRGGGTGWAACHRRAPQSSGVQSLAQPQGPSLLRGAWPGRFYKVSVGETLGGSTVLGLAPPPMQARLICVAGGHGPRGSALPSSMCHWRHLGLV